MFFHIVDTADGRFVRRKHWATGNGWALMGLARVIEETEARACGMVSAELADILNRLLDAMLAYQLPDGRFHDILDDPESFIDGTSAMMAAATVFRGILRGYVSWSCLDAAETAWRTVTSAMDRFGLIHQVCGCPDFISEGTSAEAQAAYIMADTWRAKLNCSGTGIKHSIFLPATSALLPADNPGMLSIRLSSMIGIIQHYRFRSRKNLVIPSVFAEALKKLS